MLKVIRLRFDDRADFDRWQAYVHGRDDSHCSDLAEWRLLYRELYRFRDYSYLCLDRGRIVGALSLYHIRSPLMGNMLVTCPFFGCGGFYWENESARATLLDTAEAVARERSVDYIELRSKQELPPPYRANRDFAEFDLELGPTTEQVWKRRLRSNVRQNIRKSRGQDLEFRLSASYRPCYDLLRRTLRAHGTPFHGERFFRLLEAHLGRHTRYAEVWHQDRLVAGGIVIRFKHTIITPYIGSLHGFRALRANYRQYWGLIEHYSAQGVARFDMGRSPRGSTHARFKTKWGCREIPVYYNYLVVNPRKHYRSVSEPSAVQRLATRVWKRLPLAVTTIVGPRLFRYIP